MSTDEQAHSTTLSDFTQDVTQESHGADARAWQPEGGRECLTCGASVTEQYARTMGDNDNQVHECPHCPPEASNQARRLNGSAAGLDVNDLKSTTADTHLNQ